MLSSLLPASLPPSRCDRGEALLLHRAGPKAPLVWGGLPSWLLRGPVQMITLPSPQLHPLHPPSRRAAQGACLLHLSANAILPKTNRTLSSLLSFLFFVSPLFHRQMLCSICLYSLCPPPYFLLILLSIPPVKGHGSLVAGKSNVRCVRLFSMWGRESCEV